MKYPLPPHVADLPSVCYGRNPATGAPILLKLGEAGFWPAPGVDPIRINKTIGVTPEQAAAMMAGSMFGFHVPAADPASYTEAEAMAIIEPRRQGT